MGAEEYLPEPFTTEEIHALLESLALGQPISITLLKVSAAFHAIYILTYDAKSLPAGLAQKIDDSASSSSLPHIDLVLRISGDHIPGIKTENEAGTLAWISRNTSIPVPSIVCYDATTDNPLNCEFIILTRCPGVTLSDIYDSLTAEELDNILRQLIKFLVEIHSHPFTQIGGLVIQPSDDEAHPISITSGPFLDERFWFLPDIERYFPATTETLDTLNICGSFDSYTSYTIALMEKYIHAAQIQKDLTFMHTHIPRLRAFCDILPTFEAQLNITKIRLSHKDLHFANMLYDKASGKITGILDWEFASTVPYQIWDPVRAFLWNAKSTEDAHKEKYRLRDRFAELAAADSDVNPSAAASPSSSLLKDAEFTSELQEKMHNVSNMMRIIVTLIPRGQFVERAGEFVDDLLKNLEAFGV